MGRRVHALVVVVALLMLGAPAIARADAAPVWIRPVDGAVVRPFDPPRTRFGAGHLGADLAVSAGAPVRAAGPGVVAFEGSIAGSRHVVIAHAGNLRTSYSFLASIAVRRGEQVAAGAVVGTAGGTGEGHDGSVLHFGLRAGNTYLDPMALFRPVDLTAIVHLAPDRDPPRPQPSRDERRGLVAGLVHGAGRVLGAAGHLALAAGTAAERALASRFPLPAAAIAGTVAWYQQRGHCDAHAPPANGDGGSGHRVMLVAGIESSQNADHRSLPLPAGNLGYEAGEVNYFSYGKGSDYTASDSEEPIMVAAYRLAEQLRDLERGEPGREVDLLAHSQGGVVAEAFLTLIYKRGDRSYPPLGTVVTLSSPLRGDPLATGAAAVGSTIAGAAGLEITRRAARAGDVRVPIGSSALHDLAAGSELMKRLDAARLPDEVQVTTIGGATDLVVPGNVATRPGVRDTTVIPHGLNAHTAILDDPAAMRAVRSALEGKPLPCQSLMRELAGKIIPTTISTLEERAGQLAAAAGRLAEGKL